MVHLGIHPVGFLLSLKNNRWTELVAMTSGGLDGNFRHKSMEGEDWSTCIIKFEDGTSALLEANYLTMGGMEDVIDIYGTDGCMHIDLTFSSAINCYSMPGLSYTVEKAEITTGWSKPAVDEKFNLGYIGEIRHFMECCRNNTDAKVGLRGIDGLEALKVVNLIYKSSREGIKIVNGHRDGSFGQIDLGIKKKNNIRHMKFFRQIFFFFLNHNGQKNRPSGQIDIFIKGWCIMIKFCGIEFKNPFVVASSPLTSKIEWLVEADRKGAAAVSTKLAFIRQPFYGKLRMHTYPNNGSIICYDRRLDLDESLRLVDEGKKRTGLKLFANITNDSGDLDGWALLAQKHEEAGADMIEANMICPNIGLSTKSIKGEEAISKTEQGGAITGQNPEKIREIVKTLKKTVKIPVVVKLTPNVSDIGITARAAQDAGADAVCVAGGQSSLPMVDIYNNGKPRFHLLNGVSHGSLGGPAAKLMCYSLIANIAKKTSLPIVGGGGLESFEDCITAMMWGSSMVTACTSIMWYGWDVVENITRGMEDYMLKMGYKDYGDIIGKSLVHLRSSSELEALKGWPVVDRDKCTGCGRCEKPGHCSAVKIIDKKSVIAQEKCLGCGICLALCPVKAMTMHYEET